MIFKDFYTKQLQQKRYWKVTTSLVVNVQDIHYQNIQSLYCIIMATFLHVHLILLPNDPGM